ncbi:unnamed protein product [Rotaria sp. Silwood2]|nr:unnamed protein product [Rotaria sp. Silwood2]CAF2845057.1 unnamed protein product [Rotaria sp. Silwood2]CAF4015345.1 unnamed protein product [Rotaria sp. Silwood2]CAF4048321.1 unnamed protein product [Rotaria sp. Silwood2]CAF4083860.1 unnamed protein product [Rotaria sp. Silwood2]
MQLRQFFLFAFTFCAVIIAISAINRDFEDDDDSDDEYRQLKRFLWHKKTTTTHAPEIWTPKTTASPWYPPSGACSSNPCEHNGVCTPRGERIFDCKCVGPWRGIYCGTADACYRSPCQNGGTCLNVVDDYWCKCSTDYYGKNCESRFSNPGDLVNQCRPNICNTGRCVSLKTTYYCQCPDDRYGEHCEKRFSSYKRTFSDQKSFHELLDQAKRVLRDQILTDDDDSDETTFDGDKK